MSKILNDNNIILFQGDSITDCSRNKLDDESLGNGYVKLVNHYIKTHYPELNMKCINRGMSGNRSKELRKRWEKNTLSFEKIDVLSLYIGINDTWRRYDTGSVTDVAEFRDNYLYFLDSTREKFGDIEIILLSPFVLPVTPGQLEWKEDLGPKIEVIENIAKEYDAKYIPLQQSFNGQLTVDTPGCYWTRDGVHPTAKGHVLIAKEWIDLI
ncbi:SGNH/GDSL hydrolase family protein [Candidatus Epulonipiscium viviparus]|uniref:SGNH/GDSL hydrolase family protein n=1 Tax=Candidatus Epulonipiscium viviparus TaxID=420336 RepID=UPI00016C073A|nr:SGNH/GDSL hydrolase family protein [Candidatus Epulopiscium viviparus]